MPAQLLQGGRFSARFQVGRTRHQLDRLGHQPAEYGLLIGNGAAAERDVDRFADQIRPGIIQHEIQAYLGVLLQELHHPLDLEEIEKVGRRCDSHRTTGELTAAGQILSRIQHTVHRRRTALEERGACRSQGELAGRALHQAGVKAGLQLTHSSAQGIGRHSQSPRRLGKASGANDLDEHAHFVEIQHDDSLQYWRSLFLLCHLVGVWKMA